MINVTLLRKAVEFAEASAARRGEASVPFSDPADTVWNQGRWASPKQTLVFSREEATLEACGTSYCIAGYVVSVQPGYSVSVNTHDFGYEDGALFIELVETLDGERVSNHSAVAARALGLSPRDAGRLFYGNNKIGDVRQIAEEIAGERL